MSRIPYERPDGSKERTIDCLCVVLSGAELKDFLGPRAKTDAGRFFVDHIDASKWYELGPGEVAHIVESLGPPAPSVIDQFQQVFAPLIEKALRGSDSLVAVPLAKPQAD